MADAQEIAAPLNKATGAATNKKEWIEIGEGNEAEKVVKGSNEHNYLTQEFDSEKRYMFELAENAPERSHPVMMVSADGRFGHALPANKAIPYRNLILSSQIVWNGQRRNVRYYDGCTTIFVDKQPKEKDAITQAIAGTYKHKFIDGKAGFLGYERMLLLYMNICSWNVESPFRTQRANWIFRPLNADAIADATASRIDQMEEALKFAREATETKMLIHAEYLGIPKKDNDSGNDLVPKEIRALYRKAAVDDPKLFIETYGNQSIEVKYYIDKALETGKISNKFNPNKATWGTKNTVVCDISGLKSHDAISQRIFEYSQTEEGAEFLIQLKALYS